MAQRAFGTRGIWYKEHLVPGAYSKRAFATEGMWHQGQRLS